MTASAPALDALAARWRGFGTSIFTEMTELARRENAVNLAQGFPDFHGPDELLRAIAAHVATSHHQYAPGIGEERLRRAVSAVVARSTGVTSDPRTEVTITTGATEAIYATINAVVNPGDRVVVFEPLYDSYGQAVANAGGQLVPVRLVPPTGDEATWAIDWDEFDAATAGGFRLLLLNTPHNPTGKVFSRDEIVRLGRAVVDAGALVMTDEVYEGMVFDDAAHVSPSSPLSEVAELASRVIRISSAAKTFGFTGLKVGWVTAPAELSAAVRMVHQATVFSTSPVLQTAIAEIVEDEAWLTGYLADLRTSYQAKRDFLRPALQRAGFTVPEVRGTYFLMARFDDARSDVDYARHLVTSRQVAAIPPSVLYARAPQHLPWLRFAFCKREETLRLAAERLTA